ncbi:MAG: hypothetical protein AB1832_18225 [Pseudomonadota bacterium]
MLSPYDRLGEEASSQLFNVVNQHVPVTLGALPGARVVWLNPRILRDDPAWHRCGADEQAYARHLLQCCAFAIRESQGEPTHAVGHADRYGGPGLGHNGGSGRAAVLNGYHVKGLGRTPLVSADTEPGHASGGAYLEECVRETVLAEIVAAEFPHGAVPTLAIIDTGLTQTWQTDAGPKTERRCLLVRPNFLRPAHFERAVDYRSGDPREGLKDTQRVRAMLREAARLWSVPALVADYRRFWVRWAEQLAYGFVHRLPHCGHSLSNVCLGGQLLDFGAMAAMPSWARIDTMPRGEPTGMELEAVMRCLVAQLPQVASELDADLGTPQGLAGMLKATRDAYAHTTRVELLRVLGLTRTVAMRSLAAPLGTSLSHELLRLMTHAQRERFAIFSGTPQRPVGWDVPLFWRDVPPPHLARLRELVEQALRDPTIVDTDLDTARRATRGRHALRTRDRRRLYREAIRRAIYEALETRPLDAQALANALGRWVQREVVGNRRDGRHEPAEMRPLGYALGREAAYSLHEHAVTGRRWAYLEWHAKDARAADVCLPLEVELMEPSGISFVGTSCGDFEADVELSPS